MDNGNRFRTSNRSIYSLEMHFNSSFQSVVSKSKQPGIPESGHESIDISPNSIDIGKWTLPFNFPHQIGLFTCLNGVLILV